MNSARALHVSTPSDFEIALTHGFEAPRQRVHEAYTRPELLRRWLGGLLQRQRRS